jgi:hypothetical protein
MGNSKTESIVGVAATLERVPVCLNVYILIDKIKYLNKHYLRFDKNQRFFD